MTQRLFWWSVGILAAASLLPLVAGWLFTPPDHVFTGLRGLAPGDVLVYDSYLEQARQGSFAFRDLFTGEPQQANLILPLWLVFGLVGRFLHTAPPVTFHLMRVLSIPALLWAIAGCARFFFTDPRRQRLAFLLAVFGGGIGFIVGSLEQLSWGRDIIQHLWPMDLWVAEGFTYLSAIQSPHFILGTALFLAFILACIRALETGVRWRTVLAGFGGAVAFASTPFLLVLGGALSLIALVLFRSAGLGRRILRLSALWLPALPAILYVALYQAYDSLARARALQNILPMTDWRVTLASYGLLLPLALWGSAALWRQHSARTNFLLAWLVAQPILFMSPFFFQRRLTQGWQIPLAFAAAAGCLALWDSGFLRNRLRLRSALLGLGTFLILGSPMHVLANDLALYAEARRQLFSAFYLPRNVAEGFSWLKRHTDSNALILADADYALFIPAFSGRRTFVAHDVETIDFERKKALAREALANGFPASELYALAQSKGWTHVWVSKAETRFGFDLARYPAFVPVAQTPGLTIAQFERGE